MRSTRRRGGRAAWGVGLGASALALGAEGALAGPAPSTEPATDDTISVEARPIEGRGGESEAQQQLSCTYRASFVSTPRQPTGVYNITYKGATNCNFSTVLTGQASLYYKGPSGNQSELWHTAPPCSTLGTVCSSIGETTFAPPGVWNARYKGTATAPPGTVWAPSAGCTGAGTTQVVCTANAFVTLP